MKLLIDSWIPVRSGGIGPMRQITFEELLDREADWEVSLPRDDLELVAIQLLVCLAQCIFLPETIAELREKMRQPLTSERYADAVRPYIDWFDLDHPSQPFMQVRGVKAEEDTPIQKLLIGLPEGNNHAFFNETGEVASLGAACTAIALFNQASNCPSFGGGFKGSLRGGAPITTLVQGRNLRDAIWRNVVTLDNLRERFPGYVPDPVGDKPVWVEPIRAGETVAASSIGLLRGLFWQPVRAELVSGGPGRCDLLDVDASQTYRGFRKEKFNFTVAGLWPHPHGAMMATLKKGAAEWKFASFTTTAPTWTHLSEFVVPKNIGDGKEGQTPALPVLQAAANFTEEPLHLLVGGYRAKKASILERRHELFNLAAGWAGNPNRLEQLVSIGLSAQVSLSRKLQYAAKGDKAKKLKGIGTSIYKNGEDLFFAQSEGLMHEVMRSGETLREFKVVRSQLADRFASLCKEIFGRLTDPYAAKPELIPIIARARRDLDFDLDKRKEGLQQHGK